MLVVAADVVDGFLVLKGEKRSAGEERSRGAVDPNPGAGRILKAGCPFAGHDIDS